MPEQLGITFEAHDADEQWLDLFTTDGHTHSWARIDLPENYNRAHSQRHTVDEQFCRQFCALANGSSNLLIQEDCALAQFENGMKLYGRMVDVPRPKDLRKAIEEEIPDPKNLVELPSRLKLAIERCSVILDHLPGAPAEISIDREQVLRLYAKTDRTELRDAIRLEGKHQEITNYFDPALIKRALDKRNQMCITKDAFIMRGPENYYHLISAIGG
jgi:hypothetical protein